MPSYTTLAVLALAASTVSPALSAPVQVAREQALNYRELASGKRGVLGGVAPRTWKSKAGKLMLNLVVGGAAAILGTDIYGSMNHHSAALGEPGPGGSESTSSIPAPTDFFTTGGTPVTTSYATTSGDGSTYPSTSGTGTRRAIAERAEERAPDYNLLVDIPTGSNSNLNSRTSPRKNLFSRADLEKAIGLFSRMLDELD